MDAQEIRQALEAKFDETHQRNGLDYLTGEQVVTRLNAVLGVDGWAFTIKEHGIDQTGAWALGALTIGAITREQFGETAIQATGKGISTGDARKGAATDAFKKCAWMFGVGTYLSHKEGSPIANGATGRALPPPRNPRGPSEGYTRDDYNADLALENPLAGLLWTKFVEPSKDELIAFWDNVMTPAMQFIGVEQACAFLGIDTAKDINDALVGVMRREQTDIRRLYKAIKVCRERQMGFPNTAESGSAAQS